jgi:adenosylcobinamide-phosphate synthase
VMEHSLLAAHRHVFGVFFWFVLLASFGLGPAGAVLYRMAGYANRYWAFKSRTIEVPSNAQLMSLSQRLLGLLDHVPARMTAFGFAVVGNFEESITCWRRDARLWKYANEGIILAAAAGAMGHQIKQKPLTQAPRLKKLPPKAPPPVRSPA